MVLHVCATYTNAALHVWTLARWLFGPVSNCMDWGLGTPVLHNSKEIRNLVST